MKEKNTIIIIISILILNGINLSNPYCKDKIQADLSKICNEKDVVQTDRDIYFTSEEMKISVTTLDDITGFPVKRSGFQYIELISKHGSSLVQKCVKSTDNPTICNITIPDSLTSGMYYIRTYSNWQRNFSPNLYGIKLVQIVNPYKLPDISLSSNPTIELSYYSEFNKLISGVENKIILKANWGNGTLAPVPECYILSNKKDTIARFTPITLGFAECKFKPRFLTEYSLESIKGHNIPLEIEKEGIGISVIQDNSFVSLEVHNYTNSKSGILLKGTKNSIPFFTHLTKHKKIAKVEIPKDKIPHGLITFSAYSTNKELLHNRMFFVEKNKKSKLSITTDRNQYRKKDSVKINIRCDDFLDFSNFQISVRNISNTIPSSENFNFISELNLNTNNWDNFKQIEIHENGEIGTELINNILISQTNIRFNSELENNVKNSYSREINNKYLTCRFKNGIEHHDLLDKSHQIFFAGSTALVLNSYLSTNNSAEFALPNNCYGKQDIIIQSKDLSAQYTHNLDNFYSQELSNYALNFYYYDTINTHGYNSSYINWQLQKIYSGNEGAKTDSIAIAFPSYGPPDLVIVPGDYNKILIVKDALTELVDGSRLQKNGSEYSLTLTDYKKHEVIKDEPLVLFNSHPVKSLNELLELPLSYVKRIEYVHRKFYIGKKYHGGLINIIATHDAPVLDIPDNCSRMVVDFFTQNKVGSANNRDTENSIPKLSNTLYWNPNFTLSGSDSMLMLNTGDNSGTFQICITGVNKDGLWISKNKTIVVE